MGMKENFISVVFSFRNEAENIPELIRQVQAALAPCSVDYELIFVNDCSSDASLDILKGFCAEDKRIKVLNLSRRFGYNQGFLIGIKYAAGDAVITMDADLQDPPQILPQMIENYNQGADVVHTVRIARKGESLIKRGLTALAYKIICLVAGIDLIENAGNFKLLSRRAVDHLAKFNEKEPYFRGLVAWVGFKQAQVFYVREKRFAGKTHFPMFRSSGPVKEFLNGVTSFSSIPLVAPMIFALIGFVVWLAVLVAFGFSGKLIAHLAWFITSFLLLIILASLGILGLYINKIWNEVNSRPFCVLESTINITGRS